MTQQLREAFRDLDDRPLPPAPDSRALWRRGRRRQRVRQGMAAAAVLAVVAAGGSWWATAPLAQDELPPVDAPAEQLRLPDAVREPEVWVRSIEQTGAPGPLAVVAQTTTRDFWLRERERWFGVSAVDQDYHWLDLPGMAEGEAAGVALSPDGRYLGYHLGGTPTGDAPQSDVVGFGVYDTVTGDVVERRIPTRHGLSVDLDGLLWSSDSRRLVVTYAQWRAMQGLSDFAVTESWTPRTGRAIELSVFDGQRFDGDLGASAGRVWTWKERRLVGVDPANGSVLRVSADPPDTPRLMVPGPPVLDPARERFAYVGEGRDRSGASYAAGYAADLRAADDRASFVALDKRWQPGRMFGWLDDRTVLVHVGRPSATSDGWRREVLAWDVVANTTRPVIDVPDDSLYEFQLSTDALPNPFADVRSWRVPAPPPLVLLVVAGLGGVLSWRRTRRTVAAPQADPEDDA